MSDTSGDITMAAPFKQSTTVSPSTHVTPGAPISNIPSELLIKILALGPPSPSPFLVCKRWKALRGEISKKWVKTYETDIETFSHGTTSQRLQTIGERVMLVDEVIDAIRHVNASHPTTPAIKYKREELDAVRKAMEKNPISNDHKFAIFKGRISPASNPILVMKGMAALQLAVSRHAGWNILLWLGLISRGSGFHIALLNWVGSHYTRVRRNIVCGGLAWVVGFIRGLRSLDDHPASDLDLTETYDLSYYA